MDWTTRAAQVQALTSHVPSPCISVCQMDEASGLCKGCWRTLYEIAAWSTMPDAGKQTVWRWIALRADNKDAP